MPQRAPSREEVQVVISALLVTRKEASTSGVPVPVLDNDYREQEGMRIPFRELGYSCLLDCLQSMSSCLSIRQRNGTSVVYPLANEKTAHVRSLVAGQKTPLKRTTRGGRRPMRPTPWFPNVHQPPRRLDSKILSDIVRMTKSRPDGIHRDKVLEYIRDRLNCDFELEDLKLQLREVNHEVVVERDVIYPVSNNTETARNSHSGTTSCNRLNSPKINPSSRNSTVVNETSRYTNVRAAGSSDSEDDDFTAYRECSNLRDGESNDKEKTYSSKVNDNNNNDSNLINRGKAELGEKKDEPGELQVERRDSGNPEEECEADDLEKIGMLISERTRFRLEKLVQNHPEGIWCAELPDIFLKEYKFPLNYEELGFSSVSDFAAYLPDVFHSVQLQEKGDFKLFDAKSVRPNVKQSERRSQPSMAALYKIYEAYGEEDILPVPAVLPNGTCEKLVPDGVVRLGETVPQICVTELDRGVNEFIDVVVVDVFTPSFFWIQLLKRTLKFDQFMTDLHKFYSANASEYIMPIILMEKGMNCACRFDEKWHRGIIKTVRHDSTVTVLFYDYGTVQSYPPAEIHFLHRKFSALPSQAIPCGLYNVRPKYSDKWSKSVTVEFTSKVLGKPLVAQIAITDVDNNSMLICLTNTEGPEDFHINDWMVEADHAVYGKMGDTVDMNDTCTYDQACLESDQPSLEGVRKPSGLSLGGLDPIVEEPDNNVVELKHLQAVVDELRRDIAELLRWKNLVCARALVDDTPTNHQYSPKHPPAISPMPKQFPFAFDSRIETNVPLENGNDNLTEESAISNSNISAQVKAPSSLGKFDANMNPNDGFVNRNPFPVFTSSNNGFVNKNSLPVSDPSNNATSIPRKKFVNSFESSVRSFLQRCDERSSDKLPVAPAESLPSSNPFKIHLDGGTDLRRLRETAPTQVPPPLPPRIVPARKPWNHLMEPEDGEESAPSATKFVYEAAPIVYDTSRKAANGPIRIGPAFPKQEVIESSIREKAASGSAKNGASDRQSASRIKKSLSPGETFAKNCNETDEDRNLMLFNESYSALGSRSLIAREFTNSSVETTKNPPPLPPRPVTFDFNSLPIEEQSQWLNDVQYSDTFRNDESLERNEWQSINDNDVDIAASIVDRDLEGKKSIDGESSLKRADSPKRKIEEKHIVHAGVESDADYYQFKAFPLPHRTVYIFNLDGEGWLATEEFAAEFTNFHALTMVNILKTMGITIPYRTLSRTENLRFFEKLDRTSLCVSRDENGKISDILHLTPLRSTLKILRKLKFITDEEVQRAMKDRIYPEESKTLLHMVMVIQEYSKFQQSLESSNSGPM